MLRVDFTSALYLGMRHAARQLPGWPTLTLGKPAALEEDLSARQLASELALLMDCEAACMLPSSLHLFWDLFGMLARTRRVALVDSTAYPVARWGVLRARGLGMPAVSFSPGDVDAARRLAHYWRSCARSPVLLADGYTPGAQAPPPLRAYADLMSEYGGLLLLDDTQALGILGPGGGGSLPLHGLHDAPVLVVASLAKGFGVPVSVLAGSADVINAFLDASETRRHCSPPSSAVLAAGRQAVELNMRCGDDLRAMLRARIGELRSALRAMGTACEGGMFPVQRVPLPDGMDGQAALSLLSSCGIECLLQRPGGRDALTLLLRADHTRADVTHAVKAIQQTWEVFHGARV